VKTHNISLIIQNPVHFYKKTEPCNGFDMLFISLVAITCDTAPELVKT